MNSDFLPIVNEANKYWGQLGPRETYLFYSQIIPKGKYFNKWIKGSKDTDYEPWLIEVMVKYFEISEAEVKTYLNHFYRTDGGREELKTILEGLGIDPKKIKKVKL